MTGNQAIIANFFPLLGRQLLVLALLVSTAYPDISFAQQNPLQRLMQQQQGPAGSPPSQNIYAPATTEISASPYDQQPGLQPRVKSSPLSQAMQRVIASTPHTATENKIVPVSLGVPASKSQIAFDNQFRHAHAPRTVELTKPSTNQKYPSYHANDDVITVSIKPSGNKLPQTTQNSAELLAKPASPLTNLIEISSIQPAESFVPPLNPAAPAIPYSAIQSQESIKPLPSAEKPVEKTPTTPLQVEKITVSPQKIETVAADPAPVVSDGK